MYRVEKNERSLEAEMEEQPTRANPMSDALKPNSSSTSDADEVLLEQVVLHTVHVHG